MQSSRPTLNFSEQKVDDYSALDGRSRDRAWDEERSDRKGEPPEGTDLRSYPSHRQSRRAPLPYWEIPTLSPYSPPGDICPYGGHGRLRLQEALPSGHS